MSQSRIALLKEIDCMRKLMIATAKETGYTSEATIRCSQELDRLIFDFQTMNKEPELQGIKGTLFFRQMILFTKKNYVLNNA